MKKSTSAKILAFRVIYLIITALILLYSLYLLLNNIAYVADKGMATNDIINIFATTFALMFETSIMLFIIRSMRSRQTLLMKNLVFKRDGKPYMPGVVGCAVGGILLLAASVVMLVAAYGNGMLEAMAVQIRLFIADVTLMLGTNLAASFVYFLLFRHESGSFEII
jgi:hypothetical protein